MFQIKCIDYEARIYTGFHSKKAFKLLTEQWWNKKRVLRVSNDSKCFFKHNPVTESSVHVDLENNEIYFVMLEETPFEDNKHIIAKRCKKKLLKHFDLLVEFIEKKMRRTSLDDKMLDLVKDLRGDLEDPELHGQFIGDPFAQSKAEILSGEFERLNHVPGVYLERAKAKRDLRDACFECLS